MALLHKLGVREIIEGLATKQFSVSEVVADQLKQIERNEFNAFVYNDFAQTKQQAAAMDARIAAKESLPLNGVMVGIKDLFCMRNVKTTACSRILENFIPPYESTTTQRLWENGAVFGGKLNMDEFAMGSTTMHSIFGYAINPWSKKYGKELVPGGSSGGSAAAVASFAVPAALGSDTGGSIRQPASFCGVVGMKPTYGRCSRWGMVAFASSLDCPGVFARNVEDTALVFNAIAGFDAKDSTTFQVPTSNYSSAINDGVRGLRIGLPKQYFKDLKFASEIDEITKKAIKIFEDNGAIIKEVSIPTIPHSLLIYYIISSVEAVSNLSRYDGVRYGLHVEPEGAGFESINNFYAANRTKGFGNEVKNRLLMGGKILNSELATGKYKHAQAVRRMLIKEFDSVFQDVDCILSPVAPIPAFGVEEEIDELTMYKNDLLTTPANMAGLPAISVPVALTKDHRPVGVQLMGRYFDEATLFKAAKALENVVGFDKILQENLLQE